MCPKQCANFFIIIIIIDTIISASRLTSTKTKVPPKVKIVSHFASPPLVANCSRTSIQCLVTPTLPNILVWWTFRGENASKLPSVHISKASPNEWKLSVECATLHHSGTYACHAALANETERVYRKEAVIQVYIPVSIEVIPSNGIVRELIGSKATLNCLVTSYPKSAINWSKIVNNNAVNAITDEERVEIMNNDVTETQQRTQLIISNISESDNGTYICHAKNDYNNQSEAHLTLIVVQKATVRLEKAQPLTARSIQLWWRVINDGNDSINRFILEMKNYSSDATVGQDWTRIDDNIEPNYSGSHIVQYLAPAVTYGFQLTAINSAGQSEWSIINATMPSDVPNKILAMKVLAATNNTLLIGWKRPHDNGAHISEYKMELTNVEQSSVIGETMIVKDAQQEIRRNYMYIFVGLEPATKYSFQVRACSYLGCGPWSEPSLPAQTSDGQSEPPQNLKVICSFDEWRDANYANISWHSSDNTRGTIIGYNITIVGNASYRNSQNQLVTDQIIEWHRINSNTTHQIQLPLKANTNYTVQMCAINLSGCGSWTDVRPGAQCTTPPHLQHNIPGIKLESTQTIGQLKMAFPRISERFGLITCYRVFVIKLPFGYTISDLMNVKPTELNLTSYAKVHYNQVVEPQAYIADEIPSNEFNNEIIIGDRKYSQCSGSEKDSLIANGADTGLMSNATEIIDDGPLAELTNYTGFVEIHVLGPNGVILRKQSSYLNPMQTSSSPLLSMPTTTNAVSPLLSSIGNPSTTILLCLISGIAIILFIIILILWLLIRRNTDSHNNRNGVTNGGHNQSKLQSMQRSKHVHSNGLIVNGILPNNQSLHAIHSLPANGVHTVDHQTEHCISLLPIHVINLAQVYRERSVHNYGLFELEFNSLPQQFDDRTTLSAESGDNQLKNRQSSVMCYDQTRVRLSTVDGQPNSDYINANFVAYNEKLYICCEGPLESTVHSFWQMIYEYETPIIVMLTGCEEQGLDKCAQYWSDDSVKQIGDKYSVSVQSVRIYSDYIIRRFQLTANSDQNDKRDVLQFHYTMWKDFTATELLPSRILRFIKHVNENYCPDRGPILVHCCAGLGRSATYIAIDCLLPEIISGLVNVYECALNLRYQRNGCIQTLKQYVFIYRALLEFAIFGDTEVDVENFETYYHQIIEDQIDNVNLLNTQFDRLEFTMDEPKSCEVALMADNVHKNRFNHVIPYDINRVILPTNTEQESSKYINASLIQTYDRYLTFITTQDPMESTLNDFVCMVYEQNVSTIVMLSEISDFCYWSSKPNETVFDNYTIKMVKRLDEQCSHHMTALELQVSKQCSAVKDSPAVHSVTLYQMCSPIDLIIAETTFALIELCETLLSESPIPSTSCPILVHCQTGSVKSAVFISLLSLIQQIRCDKRLDVFQTARTTKLQRCSTFQSFEEYAFLYTAIMDYILSRNLCDTSDVVL